MYSYSFITCTEKPVDSLRESISALSLERYEVLPQRPRPGIAGAYNEGAYGAHGEVMVFLHDDVTILGNRVAWKVIESQLQTTNCGFIGVTGTRRLESHGCWWDSEPKSMRGAILHDSTESMAKWAGVDALPYYQSSWPQTGAAYFGRCVALDGVFLVVTKAIYRDIGGFDALNFPNFDMYDIDITFRAHRRGYVNWAVPFPLMHHTRRPIGEVYNKARQKFCEKFRSVLPSSYPPSSR